MGFLSKVKNIFFEEEIVEVEEEPKKVKKEEPIAKKIELPKAEKIEKEPEYTLEEELVEEKEVKFPMDFDEDDFREESVVEEEIYETPSISRRSERRTTTTTYDDRIEEVFEEVEEETIKREEPKYDFELEYGKEKDYERTSNTHGLYEGRNAKKGFTPTPIISPIYGILDKNYKKDDVVTKKEIRLSSAPKKIDLDSVREKAYGDLTSDISQSMEDIKKKDYKDEDTTFDDDENLLYDLNDNKSPAVKKVTVGDAEEYFNELGLEYNIDYKDDSVEQDKISREKTRRTTADKNYEIEKEEFDEPLEDDGLESNLFDLIESMYDEKE